MNPKTLNRLIYLAALTVAAQYVVQGAMASGATLHSFPAWFLVADYALWAVRAFVEASVIVALFQVEPKTLRHARLLLKWRRVHSDTVSRAGRRHHQGGVTG